MNLWEKWHDIEKKTKTFIYKLWNLIIFYAIKQKILILNLNILNLQLSIIEIQIEIYKIER